MERLTVPDRRREKGRMDDWQKGVLSEKDW